MGFVKILSILLFDPVSYWDSYWYFSVWKPRARGQMNCIDKNLLNLPLKHNFKTFVHIKRIADYWTFVHFIHRFLSEHIQYKWFSLKMNSQHTSKTFLFLLHVGLRALAWHHSSLTALVTPAGLLLVLNYL